MESRCEDARMDFQAQEEEQTRDGAEDTMNIESLKCLPIASRKEEEKKSLDGWKLVDTNSAPSKPDFAALARAYGRPLIIKFYTAEIPECEQGELEVLAQIGNYTNVRPEEVVRCMNEQRALLGSLNLRIHIDIERPDLVALAKLALQNVLTRNNFALPLGKSIERVEFIMRDFVGCQSFAVLFKQKFNRLLELNIGGPTDQTKINHPAKEADSVLELLYEWMGGSCGRTLRCLRIFPFVKICPLLEGLVNNCPMLEHLTLSKLADYYQTLVFKDIKSFEFAGLGLSYSLIDLEFAKNVCPMFPNLRVLAYLDVPWDPVMITMLKAIYNENYRNRLQRHRLELYQSIDSLEKFVANTKALFICRSTKELPVSVNVQHLKGDLVITVYRAHENYIIPTFDPLLGRI